MNHIELTLLLLLAYVLFRWIGPICLRKIKASYYKKESGLVNQSPFILRAAHLIFRVVAVLCLAGILLIWIEFLSKT
jgi:hypothetical protein